MFGKKATLASEKEVRPLSKDQCLYAAVVRRTNNNSYHIHSAAGGALPLHRAYLTRDRQQHPLGNAGLSLHSPNCNRGRLCLLNRNRSSRQDH